jgi:aminoglycoside phosphotransferase (APT) family kinase protein
MATESSLSLQERLQSFLGGEFTNPVTVTGLERMAGGVSRETWSFDLIERRGRGQARQELVLRMDPEKPFLAGSRDTEFRVMRLAAARGVPVPEVLWGSEDKGILGKSFFIMRRVAGESRVNRLQNEPRFAGAKEKIVAQLGEALARIHRIPPEQISAEIPELPRLPPAKAVRNQEQIYRGQAVDPHPVLELAFRWLHAHAPPTGSMALVHGDYRVGNVIFDEGGLRAVLDWEVANLGDPMDDVAWMALRSWRGGQDHLPIGGVGTRETFHGAYERAGGAKIEPEAMVFWDIYAHVRWAVVTVLELGGFLAGQHNIELASLGRRTAEIEWDLLELLEKAGA